MGKETKEDKIVYVRARIKRPDQSWNGKPLYVIRRNYEGICRCKTERCMQLFGNMYQNDYFGIMGRFFLSLSVDMKHRCWNGVGHVCTKKEALDLVEMYELKKHVTIIPYVLHYTNVYPIAYSEYKKRLKLKLKDTKLTLVSKEDYEHARRTKVYED